MFEYYIRLTLSNSSDATLKGNYLLFEIEKNWFKESSKTGKPSSSHLLNMKFLIPVFKDVYLKRV